MEARSQPTRASSFRSMCARIFAAAALSNAMRFSRSKLTSTGGRRIKTVTRSGGFWQGRQRSRAWPDKTDKPGQEDSPGQRNWEMLESALPVAVLYPMGYVEA